VRFRDQQAEQSPSLGPMSDRVRDVLAHTDGDELLKSATAYHPEGSVLSTDQVACRLDDAAQQDRE
jgi:hypothetical protein